MSDLKTLDFNLQESVRRLQRTGQLVIDDDGGLEILRAVTRRTRTISRTPRRRATDGSLRYDPVCPGRCGSYWFRPDPDGPECERDRCQKCWPEEKRRRAETSGFRSG